MRLAARTRSLTLPYIRKRACMRSHGPPPPRPCRARAQEELEIVGGVFEGECLDKAGIERITKLPTKQELMQSTAIMLKKLPATLAQRLNEAGAERIARATKQASGQKLVQAVKAIEGKL